MYGYFRIVFFDFMLKDKSVIRVHDYEKNDKIISKHFQ